MIRVFNFFSQIKRFSKNQGGVTLVELLVAISITTIILGIITATYVMGLRSFQTESVKSQLQTQARTTTDRMADDIKSAISVEGQIVYNAIQYNSNSSTMILKIPAIDANNNIKYNVDDYYIYIIDTANKNITKTTITDTRSARTPGTQTFLSGIVTDPTNSYFSYSPVNPPNTDIVTIHLKVSQVARNQTYSYQTSYGVKLRNKQ